MEFLNTFTSDNISDCGDVVDLQIYSSIFTNECPDPEVKTQQALSCISGYTDMQPEGRCYMVYW